MSSLEKFKKIIENSIYKIEHDGDFIFFRLPKITEDNLLQIIRSKDLSESQKIIDTLIAILCDEKGKKIFEKGNQEHYEIVESLPANLQIKIFEEMMELIFQPKKK